MTSRAARDGLLAVALASLCACSGGGGGAAGGSGGFGPPATGPTASPVRPVVNGARIDTDPFSNTTSQHATEVEPSAASHGDTIVAAFQAGRFFAGGASDIDFATSFDGGRSWTSGSLPQLTSVVSTGSLFDSASDASVAYDAKHAEWLVATLPVVIAGNPPGLPGVFVDRSADGLTWGTPIGLAAVPVEVDKNWIACDDHPASPYYGNCYVEWDDGFSDGVLQMSVSSDGGLTWGAPQHSADSIAGIGGQPVVLPDGTVVVPTNNEDETAVVSFRSTDGGATWSASRHVGGLNAHDVAGNIRYAELPGAAVDGGGTLYVAWQDCSFRPVCYTDDIVYSTTTDGLLWQPVVRLPLDATTSTVDHFIVGVGADANRAGHATIVYYSYDEARCTVPTCALRANATATADGGRSWSAPAMLAGPMSLTSLPQTTFGAMIGDYAAAVYTTDGTAVAIFASADLPASGRFDEAMFARSLAAVVPGAARFRDGGERLDASAPAHRSHRRIIPPD